MILKCFLLSASILHDQEPLFFNFFSHMTLSEDGDGSLMTPPVTSPNQRQQSKSSNDLDNMQYSPNATVNGYEPYSSPVTPEVIAIPPELSPDKLPVEDLKVLLRHQLEFYFSRLVLVTSHFSYFLLVQ